MDCITAFRLRSWLRFSFFLNFHCSSLVRYSRGDTVAGMEIVIGSCLRVNHNHGLFIIYFFDRQGAFLSFDDTATYGFRS